MRFVNVFGRFLTGRQKLTCGEGGEGPLTKHISSFCMQCDSVLRIRLQVEDGVLWQASRNTQLFGVWALNSQEKSVTCDLSPRSRPDDYSTVFSNVSEMNIGGLVRFCEEKDVQG